MKILLTGGAGFIGSNVAEGYIQKGHHVVVIDDLSRGKEENVPQGVTFYKTSIGSADIEKIFQREKPDIVNHHAAQIDVRKSVENPSLDAKTNILDSLNLLQMSVKYGVKKIIYASTGGAIYGEPRYTPVDENHPINPISPYGVSKYAFEKYLEIYHKLYGIKYTILRYANVYGPKQDPYGEAGVVAIFSKALLKGERCKIYGDGNQTRDYIFVEDVVEGNILSLTKGDGEILNLGTATETSVNELFQMMKSIISSSQDPEYLPIRPGEITRISLSWKKAEKVLGWKPKTSLKEGLKKVVEYFKKKL